MRFAAVFVLLLVTSLAVPASAADITITLEKDQLRARMLLSVHQNMTDFPNQTSAFNQTQDPDLYSTFERALGTTDSATTLSDFTVNLNSAKNWLNLTVAMRVSGVTNRTGDISAVSTAWRAFNISADLRAGNLSYNIIGRTYLRPVVEYYVNASRFVSSPNATITGVSFFINGNESVSGEEAANRIGNLTVLDLTLLNTPLEQWTRTYDLSNNTTTWLFTPPSILNCSLSIQESNHTRVVFSNYAYSAKIVAPGLARADGNTLLVDVGTGQREWIMLGIVVLAILSAAAMQMLFRVRKKKAARMPLSRK